MITIPTLSDVTDILDTDQVMVTDAQGQSYKIAGSELNKRHKVIIASSTTVTGAPLKTGNCVRIYFTVDITAANATTTMQINYNNVNYYVKVPKNGTLANYVAFNLGGSPAVFKYVQAYTTLELLFDGTQFIIMCNPVVISGTNFSIYADGLKRVDEVTENGTDLVTSHAVAAAIDKVKDIMGALPTDAVLHYSFDDVPDYPDGTAVARNLNGDTYNVYVSSNGTISFDAYTEDGKIHKSNINGNANYKTNVGSNRSLGIYFGITSGADLIRIIEFEAKTPNIDVHIFYRQNQADERTTIYPLGNSISVGKHKLVVFVPQNCFEYSIVFYSYASDLNYTEWELTGYYLGDGSYTTPIIDNANGQNNATNNGGIATKGVSGKGAYFPNATKTVNIPNFIVPTSNDNLTISLWVNFANNYPVENVTTGLIRIGAFQGLFGLIKAGENIAFYARDNTATRLCYTPIVRGEWHNIVLVYNGTTHKGTLYDNGINKATSQANVENYQFGSGTTSWTVWGNQVISGGGTPSTDKATTIDDLLIFDRALTENEVMALYLNRGNTPKYYPPAQLPS